MYNFIAHIIYKGKHANKGHDATYGDVLYNLYVYHK